MRKGVLWILMFVMLFSTACAESTQKVPDYLMEGYDGDVTYRVWDTNLFFERMQEKTGISFQFSQHTDSEEWVRRKQEIAEGINLPDVLFKAELSSAEVRDLYRNGRIIDLAPYLETYAPDLWKLLEKNPEWKKAVTLEADKDMIGVLIDRFGKDIPVMPVDGNRFATRVNVAVSRQFYGWLFGLGDKIKITKPADVVEGMKKEIEMISKNYK